MELITVYNANIGVRHDVDGDGFEEVIKIGKTNISGREVNSVNSRDIYNYLEVKRQYSDWIKDAIQKYDFEEDVDFTIHRFVNGKATQYDYIVSIDMAKELCMVSNTEKGKEVRKYFLKCEDELNKPKSFEEQVIQTIQMAQERIEELQNTIEQQKPLVSYAKSVEASVNSVLIREWVKALSDSSQTTIGQNKAFVWLRNKGYLMTNNEPYQRYIDNGYFESQPITYATPYGTKINFTTKITGKGQIALAEKIVNAFKLM
jgi:anti-repressor protein